MSLDQPEPATAPASEAPWGALWPGLAARAVVWASKRTPLGRGISRKALFNAFSYFHAGPVDCLLWGAPVRLHPSRNVCERKALMRPDRMDPIEHGLLRAALAEPGAVFVDVGGNAGLYSLDAALHAGAGAHILMIEPDPALIARLDFNLASARAAGMGGAALLERCELAIGDRDGEAILATTGSEGSRGIVDDCSGAGRTVRLATLASVVERARLDRIDAMKIDVEGYEDRVLPPFLAAAPQSLWPRLLIIEHLQRDRWRPDCIADAEARGYRVIQTTRNNTVLRFETVTVACD